MTKIEELEQRLEVMEQVTKAYGIFKEEVEQLQKVLAELKESKKEEKWKPTRGDKYYYRKITGGIYFSRYSDSDFDKEIAKNTSIFSTYEECERYWHFMDTVKEKSYAFSKEEWEDTDIAKWRIDYDFDMKTFRANDNYTICVFDAIYFKTEEDAKYIINNFKDELMEYWI